MSKPKFGVIGFLALIFIAMVLRTPVASIGPLLPEIVADLALTPTLTSMLTSAPVLCFGLGAFISPWLVSKFGVNHAMLVVLILLSLSVALRMVFGFAGLLLGTIGAGLSIAVANVLLPTVVRTNFANRVPLITGIYTTLLSISASFAATIAVPSSQWFGGWNPALAIWVLPTVVAALLWIPQTRGQDEHVAQAQGVAAEEKAAVLRSPITWSIVVFFGLQSLGFYSLLGWLPTALISIGVSALDAGIYLGFASAIGIPTGLLISSLLGKFKTLAWWAGGTSALTFFGYLVFVIVMQFGANQTAIIAACLLIGLGMSATFPISLSLISTRASTRAQTTQLSTMAQGIGYLLSAVGTFAIGLIATVSGFWVISMIVLAAVALLQVGFGFYSGKPGLIPAKIS